MRFPLLILGLFLWISVHGQPCIYLAYDGFDYPAGAPLHGANGGSGFSYPWSVQNQDETVPGYQIGAMAGSLVFSDLQTTGNHASGGHVWLTAGRRLHATDQGPFATYVAPGQVGIGTRAEGDTLWASVVLRKDIANGEEVYVDFHNNQADWCNNCADVRLGMGYFGAASNVSGQPRWSLRFNSQVLTTNHIIQPGTSSLLVMRIIFYQGSTLVDLYVNPSGLGDDPPAISELTYTTTEPVVIQSMAVYLGSNAGNGSLDEVRMATSYRCVTPDPTTMIDAPPVASFLANPVVGQPPLMVTFDGSASYDPDGGSLTYLWDFGDGSPMEAGEQVVHIYDGLSGIIYATLTVEDITGQTHTLAQQITLLNEHNTFSCLTSVTCLAMADCNGGGGHVRISSDNGEDLELYNEMGQAMPISGGNEFEGLDAGAYTLIVSGSNGCRDTFPISIRVDSTSCADWVPDSCAMRIGTNLSGFADWVPERPLKNLLKHVRPELIPYTADCFCWEIQGVLSVMTMDTNGYPTHIPQSTSAGQTIIRLFLSSEGANLPPGHEYVVLYDGVGQLEMSGETNLISSSPGRIVFESTGEGNVWMNMTASQAGNHIRNIRILRIEDEGADLENDPFYEGFLDKIAPFASLRFMDWGHTNNNPIVHWEDRTQMSQFTYSQPQGVPYELMIQLANTTGKDPWICVPHAADDAFITQMALLFKEQLDTSLTIYLEYSNEVWNWIFEQAHYNEENKPSNLNYGRAMAEKAKHVFRIWHEVFGNDKHKVKRVLGIQGGFNYLNEQILSQLHPDEWDFGSPTHYVGLDHSDQGNPVLHGGSTPEDILANAHHSFLGFKDLVKQDYRNIQVYGKEVVTYEGGQHFVGNVFGIPYDYQQAMWDAQYTIGIYDLYVELHDTIRSWGCQLATNFSLASPQESIYGSWGVLNDIDIAPPYIQTAPKYQALLDMICASGPVSVNDPLEEASIMEIWPNPGQGFFQIRLPEKEVISHKVLYDLSGRMVWQDNTANSWVDAYLPNGFYLLEVNTQTERYLGKVVVHK